MPTQKTAKKKPLLSAEEKAAMRETIKERQMDELDGESALLAKIAEMTEPDRSMAKKVHSIIKANAPALLPRTWYGMPAYANKEGTAVCFFQSAAKFKARYATLGFNNPARLDDGPMWPVAYALKSLGPAEEKKIAALVKKAAG